jgi:hypothetical protein
MSSYSSIEDLFKSPSSKKEIPKEKRNESTDTVSEQFEKKIFELEEKAKEEEMQREALHLQIPYIFLKGFPISPEALRLIPQEQAQQYKAVVFFF